jgi:hypothetical protein
MKVQIRWIDERSKNEPISYAPVDYYDTLDSIEIVGQIEPPIHKCGGWGKSDSELDDELVDKINDRLLYGKLTHRFQIFEQCDFVPGREYEGEVEFSLVAENDDDVEFLKDAKVSPSLYHLGAPLRAPRRGTEANPALPPFEVDEVERIRDEIQRAVGAVAERHGLRVQYSETSPNEKVIPVSFKIYRRAPEQRDLFGNPSARPGPRQVRIGNRIGRG